MAKPDQEKLAHALEALAAQIAASPRSVVGMKVSAVLGPGSRGNVTGLKVTATGGPGGGNVTGMVVSASSGGPDPAVDLIQELREAAAAARQTGGHRAWFQGLLDRAKGLSDRIVDGAAVAAVQEAIKAAF